MKNHRALLATLIVLAGLTLFHGLPGDGGATVSANGTIQEKILVAVGASGGVPDSTLYTLNPDGSGQARLFDFHGHPKDTTGGIWNPRIGPGGGAVYFASDNAYLFTPAGRNLFRIAADGRWWEQLTPGPNSGRWNQPCPCGVVEGIVRDSYGDPWAGRPVFLKGKDMVYSGADGRFRFEDVPTGTRWLIAYRAMGEDVFDALVVSVLAGITTQATLSPDTGYRMEFTRPIPFGDRIYHVLSPHKIQWTTAGFTPPVEVYVNTGACSDIPDIDGFDVAPISGRLAIVDYRTGCGAGNTAHRGIYVANKDGGDPRLLVDMLADSNWCGAQETFWSPDERRLAVKACYGWYTYLLVYDASTGAALGSVYFNDPNYTLYNVSLHGWSPDGRWLLYSFWLNDVSTGALAKLPVNPDGSLNPAGAVALLNNTHISGATWGRLNPQAAAGRGAYLPLIVK